MWLTRGHKSKEHAYPGRTFEVQVLYGGMNRLLLRSERNDHFNSRVEVLFLVVRYLSLDMTVQSPSFRELGPIDVLKDAPWGLGESPYKDELSTFSIKSSASTGVVVARSMYIEETDAMPGDTSSFFEFGARP